MDHKQIKNIIFDLGGVIINLDTKRTIRAFDSISEVPFAELYSGSGPQAEIFNLFDKGLVSEDEFFNVLRHEINFKGPNEDLLNAWNAMLMDVPEERLDMLVKVKQHYNSYLLSNTCEPHISNFEAALYDRHGVRNFNDYFDKVFYSCRIGLRKPDKEIFEYVLKKTGMRPEETVFIDDTDIHVQSAASCGINAFRLPPGMEAESLLKELKLL
jgi:glucose-1-phosphatase